MLDVLKIKVEKHRLKETYTLYKIFHLWKALTDFITFQMESVVQFINLQHIKNGTETWSDE